MKRNTSGIYIIKNTINDKVYIGSAVCLKQRFIGHKNQFKKQAHSVRFQNFVNKYGFNTLIFEVIEYVNDKGKLIEREQYWIDYYESWKSKKGFNICKIAGSTLGLKMPMSHIDSCINRMKGNTYRQGGKWSEKEKIEIGERSREMWKNNPEKKTCTNNSNSPIRARHILERAHPFTFVQICNFCIHIRQYFPRIRLIEDAKH